MAYERNSNRLRVVKDAMGMHERRSGEYRVPNIEVLPLVPPMYNGNSHEAKVVRLVQHQPQVERTLLAVVRLAAGKNGS